jgi:hypothetical protein
MVCFKVIQDDSICVFVVVVKQSVVIQPHHTRQRRQKEIGPGQKMIE